MLCQGAEMSLNNPVDRLAEQPNSFTVRNNGMTLAEGGFTKTNPTESWKQNLDNSAFFVVVFFTWSQSFKYK